MSSTRPPSVDRLARSLHAEAEFAATPFATVVDAVRSAIGTDASDAPDIARAGLRAARRSLLTPVINATGVLLHTNLGRAPQADPSVTGGAAIRYANVELDLRTGRRGSRHDLTGPLLSKLTGADAALVVNNGAAALVLTLAAMARGRAVVVSRGELVEIGGGFRIPEVLEQSGAQLVEVGTTNRVRLADYANAVAEHDVALILKVHTSNYRMTGFVAEVGVRDLATLGVPVVADIGSGLLDRRTPWLTDASGRVPALPWLAGEPAARDTLADGADVVTFSCDKLMGSVQGGVIAGSAAAVAAVTRHPLARALRPGGHTIAALQDTLLAYQRRDVDALPFWRMATASVASLSGRAAAIAERVDAAWCRPSTCESVSGGGTLPGVTIPSYGLTLDGTRIASLRRHEPPIVARMHGGVTVLDLRTVDELDDGIVAHAICASQLDAAPRADSRDDTDPRGDTDSHDDA